jgi:hypothetical protein
VTIFFVLLLTCVLLPKGSQINEATAKTCTNENIGQATTSSCGSQVESITFILSSPGNYAKIKANAGDILTTHANSKSSNSGGNGRDSQNDIPFTLPFP